MRTSSDDPAGAILVTELNDERTALETHIVASRGKWGPGEHSATLRRLIRLDWYIARIEWGLIAARGGCA